MAQTQQQPGAGSTHDAAGPQQLLRQVFLSHTGQDEGAKNFAVSVLAPALQAAGLTVFTDCGDLQPGSSWPDLLVEAACRSAVTVVVLSKAYTERFWCMLELDLALNGHLQHPRQQTPMVIPVFYDEPRSLGSVQGLQQHWAARLPPAAPAATVLAGTPQHQRQQQSAQQAQHQEQKQPEMLPPDRQPWVDPKRWADNIAGMRERLQSIRLSAFAASKDAQWQLAQNVVAAAAPAVVVLAHVEGNLVGYEQQFGNLISQLAVGDPALRDVVGLWLHGLGKPCCACKLSLRIRQCPKLNSILARGAPTLLQHLSATIPRHGQP